MKWTVCQGGGESRGASCDQSTNLLQSLTPILQRKSAANGTCEPGGPWQTTSYVFGSPVGTGSGGQDTGTCAEDQVIFVADGPVIPTGPLRLCVGFSVDSRAASSMSLRTALLRNGCDPGCKCPGCACTTGTCAPAQVGCNECIDCCYRDHWATDSCWNFTGSLSDYRCWDIPAISPAYGSTQITALKTLTRGGQLTVTSAALCTR
jgi:hypothetical protein